MRTVAVAALTLAAAALLLLQPPGADAQPQVTLIFPEDGDVLAEPPPIIRMCFASPVNTQDLDEGGDFRFRVLGPDGRALGLRIVFQSNGLGIEIHPGVPEDSPDGQWTFEWRVTDRDTLEPATGTVNFTVDPNGSPVPEDRPPRCRPGGLPPVEDTTPTPAEDETPTPKKPAADEDDADEDQDILPIALIITGAAIGAAALGLVLYLVRRRIGFWSHRPPQQEGDESGGEH